MKGQVLCGVQSKAVVEAFARASQCVVPTTKMTQWAPLYTSMRDASRGRTECCETVRGQAVQRTDGEQKAVNIPERFANGRQYA